jgi:hypothetical protein
MGEHEIEVDFYNIIGGAAETVGKVWIVFEYTPAEPGSGPDSYGGGEPAYPAGVEVQRVEYREPGKPAVMLPAFIVASLDGCEYVENLMLEHVEGA